MSMLSGLDDGPIIGISLANLMSAVGSKAKTSLVLPAVQRTAVWSPRHIIELWDSVLRGMPIGGFLVYKMPANEQARALVTDRGDQALSDANGRIRFALLDGQQRLKALMLGWPDLGPSRDLCLWVDLGAVPNGAEFAFRVTTAGRPFGYAANSEADISAEDRREARRRYLAWLGIRAGDTDKVPLSNLCFFNIETERPAGTSFPLALRRPTPWKSTHWTIPLGSLIAELRERPDAPLDDIVRAWSCTYELDTSASVNRGWAERQLEAFRIALGLTLSEEDGYRIPLQRVPARLLPPPLGGTTESTAAGGTGDTLTTLFQRIGQNGVRLSDGDLAFSLIKQRYPHTHDAVRSIWFEPSTAGALPVGALLDQTDIVLLVFRIARALAHRDLLAEQSGSDSTTLSVGKPSSADIRRMVDSVRQSDETTVGRAQHQVNLLRKTEVRFLQMIPASGKDQSCSIGHVLRELMSVVSYRPGNSAAGKYDDAGLPRPCMAALDFDLLSILTAWLVQLEPDSAQGNRADIIETSRGELLRFILWWRLAVVDAATVAEEALLRLLQADRRGHTAGLYEGARFPGAALYHGLTEAFADSFLALALPSEDMLTYPNKSAEAAKKGTAILRGDTCRFGDWDQLDTSVRDTLKQVPEAERSSAWRLWLPLHHREIAARFWWSRRKQPDLLVWLQRAYVHETFGDYDPLALRENDKPYDLDHLNPKASVENWGERKFASITDEAVRKAFKVNRGSLIEALGNYRVIEFGRNRSDGMKSILAKLFVDERPDVRDWMRFALNLAHADLWRVASGEGTNWSVERIAAFQAAVEARTQDLYGRFWRELAFEAWNAAVPHGNTNCASVTVVTDASL